MNLLGNAKNKIEIFIGISIAIKCIFLFIIGFGRYRLCLFIASYFLIKPILFSRFENSEYLRIFFVIIAIPLLYLDLDRGQIFPLYNNNLIVFFLFFALLEILSKNYLNSYIERLTGDEIFSYCKKCGYENIELVSTCKNCLSNYEKEYNSKINKEELKSKLEINRKDLFSSKPAKRLLEILKLSVGEELYLNIKIPFIRGIHKNKNKTLCKNVIFTNRNIIFIDYKFNQRGWFMLDKLPISEVENVSVGVKHVGISDCPLLEIVTRNKDKFEFFVSMKNLNEEQYMCIANEINKLLKIRDVNRNPYGRHFQSDDSVP